VIRTLAGRPGTVAAIAAGVIAAGAGTAGLMLTGRGTTAPAPAAFPPAPAALAPGPAGAVPAGPAAPLPWPSAAELTARPVALIIPAIGVNTRLTDLGLTAAGTLQVPADPAVAGWYTGSPPPGAIGSAILIGHIDSLTGPAVFFRLSRLHPHQRVYVRRADGTLAVFRVDAVRMYAKSEFPTAAVYGPTPDPQLRLITCGGVFDEQLKSYLSNVVVYATAIAETARASPR
jgi:sortase (surface protein transpeptidase)